MHDNEHIAKLGKQKLRKNDKATTHCHPKPDVFLYIAEDVTVFLAIKIVTDYVIQVNENVLLLFFSSSSSILVSYTSIRNC